MSSPLEALAPELVLAIVEAIDTKGTRKEKDTRTKEVYANLLSFSSTCRTFRNALAPYIYRHINLGVSELSIDLCQRAADGPHAAFVKELRFSAVAPFEPSEGSQVSIEPGGLADVETCLPDRARHILSSLDRFPRLETLTLEFPYDEDRWWGMAYEDDWADVEDEEDAVEHEKDEVWRALPAKVFAAVAQNRPGVVKHLEYDKAYPRPASTWWLSEFKSFLAGLKSFRLSLAGGDNGAGWQINTCSQYHGFVGQLDSSFFQHLKNITRVEIISSKSGPIGFEDRWQNTLGLSPTAMPNLRRFTLEQAFIDTALVDFIRAHNKVLKTVVLRDCYSGRVGEGITWKDLFTSICESQPKCLERFRLDIPELDIENDLMHVDDEEIQRVDAELQESDKIFFPYAYVDDKYGFIFSLGDEAIQAFDAGEDQRTWDQLQTMIERNIENKTA